VLAGNTVDNTTLEGMPQKIEAQYGKLQRIWLMDRGIPTEEVLEKMRGSQPPVLYLVGTPNSPAPETLRKLGVNRQAAVVVEAVNEYLRPFETRLFPLLVALPGAAAFNGP
jgi:hypothetical protein